ncbi:hypothetical protein LUZ60_001620 [Juncus effusus]|nr:hypothetical protein LUZ60_001620 [Juncus effusus]
MGGDDCDIGLGLSIGGGEFKPVYHHDKKQSPPVQLNTLFVPKMKEEDQKERKGKEVETSIKQEKIELKRKRTHDDGSVGKKSSDGSIEDENNSGCARKKLRLTKEQSFVLEESFRSQHILTSAQKHELSKKLNLRLRQVEVWFQNRRARTKLKQTEVDYEFLKKWCENLTSENERLKRELMELRLIKSCNFPQNYLHIQKNVGIKICPSCKKIVRN